jgi:nitroreductase
MDVFNAITTRRSIRRFKAQPVSIDDLHFIIEMAMSTPSAGNLQDYRFIVVTDKAMIKELPDFCMEQMWISSAPAVIVVCSQPAVQKKWYGASGDIFARQNAAAATQNILLSAHALGLGACWVSGFNQEKIDDFFDATGRARIEAVIPIGYPAQKPEPKSEFTINNMLFFNTYGMDISEWDKFNKDYAKIREKRLGELHDRFKEKSSSAKVVIKDIGKKLKETHVKVKEKLAKENVKEKK